VDIAEAQHRGNTRRQHRGALQMSMQVGLQSFQVPVIARLIGGNPKNEIDLVSPGLHYRRVAAGLDASESSSQQPGLVECRPRLTKTTAADALIQLADEQQRQLASLLRSDQLLEGRIAPL